MPVSIGRLPDPRKAGVGFVAWAHSEERAEAPALPAAA
jgi:predicted DNA-binding transcriptional regulator AlpA